MTAAETGAALAAHRIDFVDEDNGGGDLLGLFEQVPDTAGAYTYIHLYKVRAGNGEELHPGFSGNCPGK